MTQGQVPHRSEILTISLSLPCEITTTEEHGYTTLDFIRLTNLNGLVPIPIGADQLNGNRYRIVKTSDTSFTLQDPITYKPIDSTNYSPYGSGGNANLIATEFIYYGDS